MMLGALKERRKELVRRRRQTRDRTGNNEDSCALRRNVLSKYLSRSRSLHELDHARPWKSGKFVRRRSSSSKRERERERELSFLS
jgi:hypothetical protein